MLTAFELALSPFGRVIFYSSYPALTSLAVAFFDLVCATRSHWTGISHAVVAARDLRVLVDDPGPYLLGVHSLMRPAAAELAPEICTVDLDMDRLECRKPFPGAISTGSVRAAMRAQLEAAVGNVGSHRGVVAELKEAYAGGRFSPWTDVEIDGELANSEKIRAPWPIDEQRVVTAFESVLSRRPSKARRCERGAR